MFGEGIENLNHREKKRKEISFHGVQREVEFVRQQPLEGSEYPGFNPCTEMLKKGSVHGPDAKPLDCDIIAERDIGMKLRDGVTIYTDVFRPVTDQKVPAIVSWTPYGKHFHIHDFPGGIERRTVSNLQKQECADPGFWCCYDYAVVQPDTRGAWNSEGDTYQWGTQEGKDAYDFIEWVAAQEWCNGKVVMSGNSWGAIGQWWAATENPPHLAAIAPWEGLCDVYNDVICRGGIPDTGFTSLCTSVMVGKEYAENISDMVGKIPIGSDPYWQSKVIPAEKITVPVYVVASYVSTLHTHGTFEMYKKIKSQQKWLRVHNTHEWPDLYEYQGDLKRFFDYIVKGVDNGWEATPRVRLSVLDRDGEDVVNRPELDWPIPDTRYMKYYLHDDYTMSVELPEKSGSCELVTDDRKSIARFSVPVEYDSEFVGCFAAHLYVSTESSDDADLFVYAIKDDGNGKLLPPIVKGAPFSGTDGADLFVPNGRLRVSNRELNEELSTEHDPVLKNAGYQKIQPGKIYRVDIPLWPIGMKVRKGQRLTFLVSGYKLNREEWPIIKPLPTINKGKLNIYTGGDNASYITAPYLDRQ